MRTAEADIPAFEKLLQSLLENVKDVNARCTSLAENGRKYDTSNGLSFLEVKNHSMISYLTSLAHLIHTKLSGRPLQESSSLDALLEQRVVLEKIRPIEAKFKYRIDKMIRSVDSDATNVVKDPLSYKPNLKAMVEDNHADFSVNANQEEQNPDGIYRPLKVAPVHYDNPSKKPKRAPRLSNRLLRDLQSEYDDRPENTTSTGVEVNLATTEDIDHHFKEKREHEESNFVRLNVTREEKRMQHQKARHLGNEMNDLVDDFGRKEDDDLYNFLEEKRNRSSFLRLKRKGQSHTDDDRLVEMNDNDNEGPRSSSYTARNGKTKFQREKSYVPKKMKHQLAREKKRKM